MAGRKHNKIERDERILYLLGLRSKGVKGASDLFRYFSEKYPDLTKRQFEYDLQEAKVLISQYFEKDSEFQVAEIEKHYWELYSKSLKLQDYRECRAILSEVSKLKALIVERKDHTVSGLPDSIKVNIIGKIAPPVKNEDDINEHPRKPAN